MNSESHAKSWLTPQFMDNIGASLEFADPQGNRADKDDNTEVVTFVRDNPLVACSQVAEFEDRSYV